MKKYTQQEYDAMPIVDGLRQCPTGDYSQCEKFDRASFGKGASFGARTSFGECVL